MKLINLFKRETSSGKYIPQLDGLRFIAIISVLAYHSNGLLQKRWHDSKLNTFSENVLTIFNNIFKLGNFGVPIFFCISGYILSQPLWNTAAFSYKKYIIRRVSRIEPPFIITIFVFGIGVWLKHTMSSAEFFKEFFSTLFYLHNIIVPAYNSKINGVTWSLEIEVQFYLLIPFIILYIRKTKNTIIILIASIIFFYLYNLFFPDRYKLLNDAINYFSIGMLVSYVKEKSHIRTTALYFPGMNLFLLILVFYFHNLTDNGFQIFEFLNYFVLFFLFYNVLVINKGIKFLSYKLISYIGGMCYTIYLIHFPIITLLADISGKVLPHNVVTYLCMLVLNIIIAVSVCSIMFLVIEKPFMKKEWFLKFYKLREYKD